MLYYGIDVGVRKVAVASVTATGTLGMCFNSTVRPREQRSRELRDLCQVIRDVEILPGDQVAVEAPVVAGVRNLRTSLQLATSIGAVISGIEFLVNVTLVEPSKWKTITGNGHSTKTDVQAWLAREWPDLETACRGNGDMIDAMCIAVWNLRCGTKYAEADDE